MHPACRYGDCDQWNGSYLRTRQLLAQLWTLTRVFPGPNLPNVDFFVELFDEPPDRPDRGEAPVFGLNRFVQDKEQVGGWVARRTSGRRGGWTCVGSSEAVAGWHGW